jgi:hypothetical protein
VAGEWAGVIRGSRPPPAPGQVTVLRRPDVAGRPGRDRLSATLVPSAVLRFRFPATGSPP